MSFLSRHATRLLALSIILVLYGFALLPDYPASKRQHLAARFHFTRLPLPELPGYPQKTIRQVNPSLQHIAGWISAVGAGVALADLDGDGLANDLCHVDPRTDQVIVSPVPGTGERYKPFVLNPQPLPYDATTMAPMGCLPGDLNEDGLMDILVYYWGRTPVAFLRKPSVDPGAPLQASDYVPVEVVPGGGRWYTNAATLADLDGDGHLDLVIGNYFPDGARILDAHATVPDHMQHSMSRAFNGGGPHLLLAEIRPGQFPGVQFREVTDWLEADPTAKEQVNHGWTLAVGAADLDGDLLPELYFANDFGPDHLLYNRSTPGQLRFTLAEGKKGFTTPSSKVLGRDSFKGMGVDFADLNGDGWPDILVSNIAAEYALEESHFAFISTGQVERLKQGVAPYVDRSESLGLSRSSWAWDIKVADFANDGTLEVIQATGFLKGAVNRWPELQELAMGNDELLSDPRAWPIFQLGTDLSGQGHNPFYVQGPGGRYVDIAAEVGLDQPQISRGIAIADVDGNGKLSFAVANQWEPSYFYRNDCRCGRFLSLNLRLPVAGSLAQPLMVQPGITPAWGRPAIGASARLSLPDGRMLVAQVDGGNGHSGKRSPELHFGLGDLPADTVLPVELRWRDGQGQVHFQPLQLRPGRYTVQLGTTSHQGETTHE
jgi:hypothetical protein